MLPNLFLCQNSPCSLEDSLVLLSWTVSANVWGKAQIYKATAVWRWIPEESVAYLRALPVSHVLSLPRFRELSMPENRNIAIPRCRKATSGRFGDAPISDFSDYSPIVQTNATLCGYGQLEQASNSSRRPSTRNEPEKFTHS